jgi:hypothetical protein
VTVISLIATSSEKSANRRPCGKARQLRQCAGKRDRELNRAITARFDSDSFATLSVVHRTACDGARSITADLDHQAGNDGRLGGVFELVRWTRNEVRFRAVSHETSYSEPWT